MIKSLLAKDEGKTLEFKRNCSPLAKIVQTAVAFANTAGGTLVIGIHDKTKSVLGLSDPLKDEERLANAFADGIRPLLIPEIQIHAWRDKELIVVSIPHAIGPYYVKSEGPEKGVYIRLGSTNRRAGPDMIAEIRRLARNTLFDEQPCSETSSEDIDFRAASELFSSVSRQLSPPRRKSLAFLSIMADAMCRPMVRYFFLAGTDERFSPMQLFGVLVSEEKICHGFWIKQRLMNTFQRPLRVPWPSLKDTPWRP